MASNEMSFGRKVVAHLVDFDLNRCAPADTFNQISQKLSAWCFCFTFDNFLIYLWEWRRKRRRRRLPSVFVRLERKKNNQTWTFFAENISNSLAWLMMAAKTGWLPSKLNWFIKTCRCHFKFCCYLGILFTDPSTFSKSWIRTPSILKFRRCWLFSDSHLGRQQRLCNSSAELSFVVSVSFSVNKLSTLLRTSPIKKL